MCDVGRGRLGGQIPNVKCQRGKLLTESIVELTREAPPLFFLGPQQTGCQSANFLSARFRALFEHLSMSDVGHESGCKLTLGGVDVTQSDLN